LISKKGQLAELAATIDRADARVARRMDGFLERMAAVETEMKKLTDIAAVLARYDERNITCFRTTTRRPTLRRKHEYAPTSRAGRQARTISSSYSVGGRRPATDAEKEFLRPLIFFLLLTSGGGLKVANHPPSCLRRRLISRGGKVAGGYVQARSGQRAGQYSLLSRNASRHHGASWPICAWNQSAPGRVKRHLSLRFCLGSAGGEFEEMRRRTQTPRALAESRFFRGAKIKSSARGRAPPGGRELRMGRINLPKGSVVPGSMHLLGVRWLNFASDGCEAKGKAYVMRTYLLAATSLVSILAAAPVAAATFEWVTGSVTSVTAQLPEFTVFVVGNKTVRFCNPGSGADFPVTADNMHYDLLKTALENGRTVQVGVQNYGNDPQSGDIKRCVDRVILTR
jgi:hypothetical protein